MARRWFDMIDVVEILQHWHAGRPKAVVASSLGVDPKTVRTYTRPAEEAGMTPGGPPLSRDQWAALAAGWFPELVDAKARSLTFAVIDAHRERIAEMVRTNKPSTVFQRLRDEHDLRVSVTSFRRYLWSEFPGAVDESRVTVLRPEVPAGEEGQVDYGFLGSWSDPVAQRVRRVWAFVLVLAASRHMFVRPVLRMDQGAWVGAHVAAFEFFGGAPRRVVPDNLKTGWSSRTCTTPSSTARKRRWRAHYGVLIDPARASKPKDKPRVERPMSYVRDSMWRGREWTGEADMRRGAVEWCVQVAGRRSHRWLDDASPLTVFGAVEAGALMPLPPHPFELATWSTPKVGPDSHVKVGGLLLTS
jgi:transposase